MTDNQRFVILFEIIIEGLTERNVTGVSVLQSYQPTQQGTASGRAVYLSALPQVPVGHVRRDSVYDVPTSTMVDSELQTWLATYQVNALAKQDLSDTTSLTAADIVRAVRNIMQSSKTIARLRTEGLAILRVNELRNPSFVDDNGQFEYSPSFDFTLTYDELYTAEGLVVETVEYNINRV